MQVNFIESNPIPVKAAMAELGLLDLHYRLPMCPPTPADRARIAEVLAATGLSRVDTAPGAAGIARGYMSTRRRRRRHARRTGATAGRQADTSWS